MSAAARPSAAPGAVPALCLAAACAWGQTPSSPAVAPASTSTATAGDFAELDRWYFHRHEGDNLARSIGWLEERLAARPQDPAALWRLGRSLVRRGERLKARRERLADFGRARAALERAAALGPGDPEAHFWLGIALGREGETRGILRSLFMIGPLKERMRRVLALDPRHGGAHHVLGEMYRQLPGFAGGSKRKAVEELELAVALSPDYTAHYPALAGAYLEAGQREKAREALLKIRAVSAPEDPAEYPDNLADARRMLAELE